jgi:hypothetical protein
LTSLGDADAPRLLDDEEAAAAIARIDHSNRLIEAIGHDREIDGNDT